MPRLEGVVARMVLADPNKRPSFTQLIRHLTCLQPLVRARTSKLPPTRMRKAEACLKQALTYVENSHENAQRRSGHFGVHHLNASHSRLKPTYGPNRRRDKQLYYPSQTET